MFKTKIFIKAIAITIQALCLAVFPVLRAEQKAHIKSNVANEVATTDCSLDEEIKALGSAMMDLSLEAKISAPAEYNKMLNEAKNIKPGLFLTDSIISSRAATQASMDNPGVGLYPSSIGYPIMSALLMISDEQFPLLKGPYGSVKGLASGSAVSSTLLGSTNLVFKSEFKSDFDEASRNLKNKRNSSLDKKSSSFIKDENKLNGFIEALAKSTEPLYNSLSISDKEAFKLSIKNELSLAIIEQRDPDIVKVMKRYYESDRLEQWGQLLDEAVSINKVFTSEAYEKLNCDSKKTLFRAGIQQMISTVKSSKESVFYFV